MSATKETGSEAAQKPNVVVVMPAYNAASTVVETREAIPPNIISKVILVDDKSKDQTIPVARDAGIEVIAHPHNVGYGGNQKTCYMAALREGADVVVMLHPDGQYDPAILPAMVNPIVAGEADMTLGSRFLQPGGPQAGGMPLYKIIANRFLTTVENYVLGTHYSELHTGYRAYSRKFLETVPFLRNSNDFVFDTQVIAQSVAFDMRVKEVPVQTKYFEDASSTTLRQSIIYGSKTLAVMLRYRLHSSRSESDKPQYGELKMTIAEFFRINGGSTQLKGVTPDIAFPKNGDEKDFGESTYDNALEWTHIPPAPYQPIADMKAYLPKLEQMHDARVVKSPAWQLMLDELAQYKIMRGKKAISLNLATREAERKQQDAIQASFRARHKAIDGTTNLLDEEDDVSSRLDDGLNPNERSLKSELKQEKEAKEAKDVQLDESAHVLFDAVGLIKADPKLAAEVLPYGGKFSLNTVASTALPAAAASAPVH